MRRKSGETARVCVGRIKRPRPPEERRTSPEGIGRVTKDYGVHNLLDRPRDAPWRTALGAGILTWIFLVFATGSADRVYVMFGISYRGQIWAMRLLVWVIPLAVTVVTKRVCDELRAGEAVEARRQAAEAEASA